MERLAVNYVRELIHRLRHGQSERAVAAYLRLSRLTVRKYRALARRAGLLDPETPLPEGAALAVLLGPAPLPPRRPSTVLPYQSVVERLLAAGVEQMTIFDRLVTDHGYTGSYSSVRRFVQQLRPVMPTAVVRVHRAPGEEVQVDFGAAGRFVDPVTGQLRPAWVFVMTLAYSRHQYAEIVFDQRVSTWVGCHRRAFESFGGVPERVVVDNLKAAVLVAALHDPVLGEAYRRFAQHYDFVVSPTRPRTPQHKGKVENGVHFVTRSFLAGLECADLRDANRQLAAWVRERAGTRDHGTTHRPPLAVFETEERRALRPLPVDPFELLETRVVKLHRDCHVVIDGSYYSAPFRYIGQQLDAYLFERVVQLFLGTELLITHPRAQRKGEWSTLNEHYPPEKAAFLERTPVYCRQQAGRIGPATAQLVEALLSDRPLDRLRSVQGVLHLRETVGPRRLEAACARALAYGDGHYRRVKAILNAGLDFQPPPTDPSPPASGSYTYARSAEEFFGPSEAAC